MVYLCDILGMQVTQKAHLVKDQMSRIMEEPEGGNALARPQCLQVCQKGDCIKVQKILGK